MFVRINDSQFINPEHVESVTEDPLSGGSLIQGRVTTYSTLIPVQALIQLFEMGEGQEQEIPKIETSIPLANPYQTDPAW